MLFGIIIYLLIGLVLDLGINHEFTIFTPVVMLFWPIPLVFEIFNR